MINLKFKILKFSLYKKLLVTQATYIIFLNNIIPNRVSFEMRYKKLIQLTSQIFKIKVKNFLILFKTKK